MAKEDVEKIQALEDRIRAPSIWVRLPCGLRIEDLQERRYEDAVRLIKRHYITEEITWKSVKISEDKEATDELIHNVRIWLKDKMSLCVIKEGTEKMVGVLILRIQEKAAFSRTFSKNKITYNPLYSRVMKFYNDIEERVDLFDLLGVRKYLKFYIMALKNRYRHRGISKDLFKSAMYLAESAYIPGIAGVFTTGRGHRIAEDMGFKKYNEIYYVRYLIDDKIVFWDTGVGNYGAALMAYRIPNVEEPEELYHQPSSRFNVQISGDAEDKDEADGDADADADAVSQRIAP